MGKKPYNKNSSRGTDKSKDRFIRSEIEILQSNNQIDNIQDEEDEEDQNNINISQDKITTNICLWEFNQNDPKRDSGSKLCRQGYAKKLRIGQSFPGVVLSSEATIFVSPADQQIVSQYGIAGINCSWNRLNEIPFDQMGKGRNQRILPILLASNSVNYGKPYKMNTVEAIAACLYIVGSKRDAEIILAPFSYGAEFLRLNFDALEAYSLCSNADEVSLLNREYISQIDSKKVEKELKKEEDHKKAAQHYLETKTTGGIVGGYMDDMDLPPSISDDEYEEELDADIDINNLADNVDNSKIS
eukprot:gene13278-17791_t